MASIKNFKKELVYTYGALLDECYIVEMVCPKADREKLQALCQEIEQAYDDMADRLGSKDREKGTAARAGRTAPRAAPARLFPCNNSAR